MKALRPGLSFCAVDDHILFLDAQRDRYFALSPSLSQSFRDVMDAINNGRAVEPERASAFMARGLLVDQPGNRAIASSPRHPITEWSTAASPARARMAHLMLAFACILWARIRIRIRPFQSIVRDRRHPHRPSSNGDLPDHAISIFLLSLRLWPSRLECLPASVALRAYLACFRVRSRLVLGVKLHPFEAHCWVQVGDRVVGDTLDHVGIFTPIRSVS